MKLKDFQLDSVIGVLNGLDSRHGVYALADEVGLGKTLVCAEVALNLIKKSSSKKYILFYIAPSIELLDQNLKSVSSYLKNNLDEKRHKIYSFISRISKLPYDLSQSEDNKKNVYLVGLSPETSFKMRGAGLKDERAYLAALFGINCGDEWKNFLEKFFWCIPNKNPDFYFTKKISDLSTRKCLGSLYEWRNSQACKVLTDELLSFRERKVKFSSPEARSLVGKIRRSVVAYLVDTKETLPKLIMFDEWHKYKNTCFESRAHKKSHEHLVGKLLSSCRKSTGTKVLFVSATPFTVDYNEMQGDAFNPASSDLRDLLKLFWEPEQFEHEYQKHESKQVKFVDSIRSLLKNEDNKVEPSLKLNAGRCCKEYEKELKRYCVRTERPKVLLEDLTAPKPAEWSDVFSEDSLKEFIKKYKRFDGIRTPITSMWMDGHCFPEAGYDGLKSFKVTNIRKNHWKIKTLLTQLNEDFAFDDKLHSFNRPPLWIQPKVPLTGVKQLIFSEFKFVPDEICQNLKKSKFGPAKKVSGSVLGFFPLTNKTRVGKLNLKKSIHFPLFYPFLFWEFEPSVLRKAIEDNTAEIVKTINDSEFAVETVLEIENILVRSSGLKDHLIQRRKCMDETMRIPATSRYKEYLYEILFSEVGDFCPGRIVAEVVKSLRLAGENKEKFELRVLELSEAIFHMLISPEAQVLKIHAKITREIKIPRHWNAFLRFSMWYCYQFELADTLFDFSRILMKASRDGSDILSEIISAISLRRGSVGTRFARSFHDRKVEGSTTGGKESVSTKSIRAAFNSPFPPYVLASTSVGQEGLDFHRYCDSIIHWNPPSSPSVLRQREGRLDRFQSLQVRVAMEKVGAEQIETLGGLSPDFVVMKNNIRVNQPKVKVLFLPYTSQAAAWKRCLERMHYDDLLIGAPDPLADERLWLEVIGKYSELERKRRLSLLQEFSISLKPTFNKNKKQ